MDMTKFSPFDVVDYLDNEELIAEYLTAALQENNPDIFLAAIADVAKARGIAQLAKDSGLARESLYKALRPGSKPRFETVNRILHALNISITATTVHSAAQTGTV